MVFYALFVCYVLLSTLGLLLIKLGGNGTMFALEPQTISMQIDFRYAIGLACYILSFLLFTVILSKRELSWIYPVSAGIINIVSVILGVAVLKETVSSTEIVGITLVIAGTILMSARR